MNGKVMAAVALLAFGLSGAESKDTYRRQIEQWRAAHQAEIAKDFGWLTVVGLDWLKEGDNRVGADPSDEVPLPPGSAPQRVAVISFHAGKAVLHPAPGVPLMLNGKPAAETTLREDDDVLAIQRLQFYLIRRGDRAGIRLKDNDAAGRKHFQGLSWFPVDRSWRIQAKYTPWPAPHNLIFHNTIGQKEADPSPGYVTFLKDGREFRLEPVIDEGKLFFVLRDQTSGKATYGASRFLYVEPPPNGTGKSGTVWLDFNQAENPPCAFTAYATCPLPPPQNRLALAITAGEKTYAGSEH